MTVDRIIVFKGKDSMTGEATDTRFPELEYEGGEGFLAILEDTLKGGKLAILPMWNSHEGKIPSNVFEYIFRKGLFLHDIWPHWIDFACIIKKGKGLGNKKVTSHPVANAQCSDFIKRNGLHFEKSDSTVDAYKEFCRNTEIDAVLCNIRLCDMGTQDIFEKNASNPLNFTTFVALGRDSEDIYDDKIKPLSSRIYPKECQVTGIEMPMFDGTLTEDQHEMFDIISEGVKSIDEIPKIIFVSDMGFGVIGLVIEHRGLWDMPDVSLMSDVRVVDAMGQTRSLYSEEVKSIIPSRYPESLKKSFIKHVGKNTFFYSCPVLNILIHGFEEKAVEAFTRHSITKHFEAIESGVNCTAEQKEFYDRFLTDYLDKGPNFPVFENIF